MRALLLLSILSPSLLGLFTHLPATAASISFLPSEFDVPTGRNPPSLSGDGTTVVGIGQSGVIWSEADGVRFLEPLEEGSIGIPGGISADGRVVVGTAGITLTIPNESFKPVLWEDGEVRALSSGAFRGVDTSADGLTVLGDWPIPTPGFFEPFLYDSVNGVRFLDDLHEPPPGEAFVRANAISGDAGTIVGVGIKYDVPGLPFAEAAIWDQMNGMRTIGILPGSGGGRFPRSEAIAVSADGSIVVGGSTSELGFVAIIWDAANGIRPLSGAPNYVFSTAAAISSDGSTVVGSASRVGVTARQAFYWTESRGMTELALLLEMQGVDLSGWELTDSFDISDDAKSILGLAQNVDGSHRLFLAVIPEPSPALLLFVGLILMRRGSTARVSQIAVPGII